MLTLSSWSLLLIVASSPSTALSLSATSLSLAFTAAANIASVNFNLWPICSMRSRACVCDWFNTDSAIFYTQKLDHQSYQRNTYLHILNVLKKQSLYKIQCRDRPPCPLSFLPRRAAADWWWSLSPSVICSNYLPHLAWLSANSSACLQDAAAPHPSLW